MDTTIEQSIGERENELLSVLRSSDEGIWVNFEKKDGSEREMLCTLNEGLIPVDKQPKTSNETSTRTIGSALPVFDINKGEWRSFRWDSINSVTVNGVKYDYQ
jgi:hypothetical protein